MSGRVVHFEVPYDDAERAGAFYADVFGWQIAPLPEMSYTMVSTGPTEEGPSEPGFINGGMLARTEGFRSPVVTLEVDDIEATLAKVEEHGGAVVSGKQQVGEMGWSAYFTDSEGNLTGLWQNP